MQRHSFVALVGAILLCLLAAIGVWTGTAVKRLPDVDAAGTARETAAVSSASAGYWLTGSDGGIFSFGAAGFLGSTGATKLARPIVGMAATPDGDGYWLVASDGGIFTFGDAPYEGSMGGQTLPAPIVGMAATPDGGGYWLVASDGAVYPFGDARTFSVAGPLHLNRPIVGMAATPDGGGYWLVASDGGIFTFGDATFFGSTGGMRLNRPIVGMAATPDGGGYWLVASDGGIFTFGDATFFGSTGGMRLNRPIVGMAATPDGGGYWLVASDGGIFTFGDASFSGSTGSLHLNEPIVGMSAGEITAAGQDGYDACPASDYLLPGEGASLSAPVTIPSVAPIPISAEPASFATTAADIPASFPGTILRPADTTAYPGRRPAIVLLHGYSGNQCNLWWLARYLAGAGYITLTVTSPVVHDPAHTDATYGVAFDAGESAVDFVTSVSHNPYASVTNVSDIGLAGWSMGSIVASELQGLPGMEAVHAVVALDNLRQSLQGDPGAPVNFCNPPEAAPITPRVPALGFASDAVCATAPSITSPTLKLSGWSQWQSAGVPAVELVMSGYLHTDFSLPSAKLIPLGPDIRSWFDAWLGGQPSELGWYDSCTDGQPSVGPLAADYDSAAYLPSLGLATTTLAQSLATSC